MARRVRPQRDDDPTDADLERFGGVTRTCPECGTEVYDDAEVCWKCGHAFSGASRPGKTLWAVVAVIMVVLIGLTLLRVL